MLLFCERVAFPSPSFPVLALYVQIDRSFIYLFIYYFSFLFEGSSERREECGQRAGEEEVRK